MEILFIVLFSYLKRIRNEKLKMAAQIAASKANDVLPIETAVEQAKQSMPAVLK